MTRDSHRSSKKGKMKGKEEFGGVWQQQKEKSNIENCKDVN